MHTPVAKTSTALEVPSYCLAVPSSLRPAQTTVGEEGNHSVESSDAAGRLPDDRASLQSAVATHAADDGQ